MWYSTETITALLDYLHEELEAGQLLVNKPGSDKKRFVRDVSSPRRGPLPSINESITSNGSGAYRFKTAWHVFDHIAAIVLVLSISAHVYITDVMNTFRQLTTLPSQCRWTVMNLNDNYYINRTLPMGLSTSMETWGSIANLLRDRLECEDSWANTNNIVDARLKYLRLPHRKEKDWLIAPDDPTFPFIGFVWCMETKTVHLLEKKRVKFLARLQLLLNRSTQIWLGPLEWVVGSLAHLAHLSHVVPEGKFCLRALFAFTAEFRGNYFITREPSSTKTKVCPDAK
ncbi:hypothetical protein JCM1840_007564 [Sporobolomyces johnsonii]